jgi:hypothetical protein
MTEAELTGRKGQSCVGVDLLALNLAFASCLKRGSVLLRRFGGAILRKGHKIAVVVLLGAVVQVVKFSSSTDTTSRLLSPARSAIVEAIGLYRSVNIVQIDGRFWFEYGHPALHRRKLRVFFDLSVFSPRSVVIDQNLERYFIG